MKTMFKTWAFLSLVFAISFISAQPYEPLENPISFGDDFVNPTPDATILNPALLSSFGRSWVSAQHERLFWGLGESIYRSSISAKYCSFYRGGAFDFSSMSANIESRWKFSFSYSQKISKDISATDAMNRMGLFAGITASLISRGYNSNNMALAQPDPLFENGNFSKIAPDIGIGVAYRKNWGEIYGGAYHLLFPNLALGDEPDRLNPAIQLGLLKSIKIFNFHLGMQYSPRYGNFWLDFDPVLGISFKPIQKLIAKGIVSGHSAGISSVYSPDFAKNFAVSYNITFPLDGIYIPSHNFGIEYLFAPLEPIFPDVVPGKIIIDGKPIPGETLSLGLPITNTGKFRTPKIPVSIVFSDSSFTFSAEPLKPEKSETVWTKIASDYAGDLKIAAILNRKSPQKSADVVFVEKNPDDNFADTSVHIFAPPHPEISVEKGELHLIQKFSIAEDEPIVPILFFDQNDSTLDSRFDHTISIISDRLAKNPDVKIGIRGYVVDGESDKLAYARARAVQKSLATKPEIANRIEMPNDYDIHHKRAKRQKFQGTKVGKIYTPQENRRVELEAKIIGESKFDYPAGKIPSKVRIDSITSMLERNPDIILAVRAPTIERAFKYKELLLAQIQGEFDDKIFSQDGASSGVELVLSPAGSIYRPPQVVQPAEGYEIEQGWNMAQITVKPNAEVPLKNSHIYIADGKDTVAKFDGTTAKWNWKLKNNLPPPGSAFYTSAEVEDTFGQFAKTSSQKLKVIVQNINEVQQRLILLQFAFAGKQSESEYTNARMEYIARKVVERIQSGDVDVIVAGHTDTIGTFAGNKKLSQRRADEQLSILRKYLRGILSFESDTTLDSWIVKNNARLLPKGFGMSEPFRIIRLQQGNEVPITVGINTLPEGRIKNRRVEILFIPHKKIPQEPQVNSYTD
ncbi:type IX secretion system membrane protein PorP/SprF [bacterium]|nr:type IX secretion system membrane protein PorP/SprF [bacterium]